MIKVLAFFLLAILPVELIFASFEMTIKLHNAFYPHFSDNPYLTEEMRVKISPHLMPLSHPLKPILDAIFGASRVTANETSLAQAGFQIVFWSKESSYVIVAKHPFLEGYLVKLYLDTETRKKKGKEGWEWLVNRCVGAKRIKRIIRKQKIEHFVVPDKWLYPLPYDQIPNPQHPIIIVVQDMHLVSKDATKWAWSHQVTTKVLDELYEVLIRGAGSNFLTGNIPYTKSGKFAFIDTEYPKREINLKKVENYLSDEMKAYWYLLSSPI